MKRFPNRGHVWLVARTELRRSWRKMKGTNRGLLLILVGLLSVPLYALGLGAGGFFLGQLLREGQGANVGALAVRAGVAGFFLLAALVTLQRTVKQIGDPEGLPGLLTTTDYADVLWGVVCAEAIRVLVVGAVPLLVLVAGFGLGTGSPVGALVLLVVVAVVVAGGVGVGYALGLVGKYVAGRSAFVSRHRSLVGISLALAFPAAYVTATTVPSARELALQAVTATPLAWSGDLVLIAVPGAVADPLRAAGAVLALALGGPALALVLGSLAERVWYMDRVRHDHAFDAGGQSLLDRALRATLPRRTRVVIQKSWRRARRAPFTVQFAIVPFFFLLYPVQMAVIDGQIPAFLPAAVALCGAFAGGAAFSLNPLGNERAVLPITLTSSISGPHFVASLGVAGAVPGIALAVGLSVPIAVAAGQDALTVVSLVVASLVAGVAAPAVASGFGVVFPKFETNTIRGTEVAVPSGLAFLGYGAVFAVAVIPATVGLVPVARSFVAGLTGVSEGVLVAGTLSATTLALALVGGASGTLAARQVGTYRLE